jgi:hypothetical protein
VQCNGTHHTAPQRNEQPWEDDTMPALTLVAQTYFDGSAYHTDGPYVLHIVNGVIRDLNATDVLPLPEDRFRDNTTEERVVPVPFVMPMPLEGPGDGGAGDALIGEVFHKLAAKPDRPALKTYSVKQCAIHAGNRAHMLLLDACPLDPHGDRLHIRGIVRQGELIPYHDPAVHN